MSTWFTSDHHFGHDNIRIYCDRPFQTVADMDLQMILNWNDVVDIKDTVWHIGDFTLGDYETFIGYANRLLGRINIIPGSHDYKWMRDWASVMTPDGWRIPGTVNAYLYPPLHSLRIKRKGERPLPLVMCHYPMASWDRSHYGSMHLHGHVHNTWKRTASLSKDTQIPPGETKGVRINMSVDVWDFYPVNFDHLLDIAGISGTLRT